MNQTKYKRASNDGGNTFGKTIMLNSTG